MIEQQRLDGAAARLYSVLKEQNLSVVFAESCTAGLVAATLGRIPGVSTVMAGSFVVYQNDSKEKWLGISDDLLDDPGPVSREVAELMVRNALERTPHADVAVSVTGHLGPDAPAEQDGVVYFGCAIRKRNDGESFIVSNRREQLECEPSDTSTSDASCRIARQQQATLIAIEWSQTLVKEAIGDF